MNLIVAADSKWGIGKDGGLLAHLPTDMKYFRETTKGKVVVMGRKTLESLPGRRGLPGRINYVLTTQERYKAEDCIVVHSEEELFGKIGQYEPDEVFLIGGAALYNAYYSRCDRLYITRMDADLGADTFMFNIDEDTDFELISESEDITENGITYRFAVYAKRPLH